MNEKDWKKRIFAGGCIRNDPLNDTHPGFVTLTNVKLPDTINAISDERKSKSECASWCQKNSSCMAYAYIGWQGCLAWFGDIIDMQKFLNAGDDLYIRVASNSESIYRKTHPIILPLSIAAVLVLLAVVIILGILENGEEIAVKRAPRIFFNGSEQLNNELNLIARLKHKHLVKLTGYCIQQQEIILCFEFMHNHSLDQLLFGTELMEEVLELNWEQRSRLIQGISSGLLYLHEDNGDTIIHRDVKPANILLDRNMVPKISDFGISRLFEEDRSFFTTDTCGGTRGYIAPELQSGMLSPKSDVYSFGIVILEIISGTRNTSFTSGLVSLVLQHLNEGRILDLKDARLTEPCSDGEIKRSIHIALLCLLEEPHRRPDMRQINHWLTCQSTHPPTLPVQASHWGNIVIDRSTVVDSSTLLQT
ncbi:G-type lectin S-receptor-like serine/threonine-protein kinase [Carex littledalei]|uniref:G-type lectin S-receptor-like serine/threonine-protein kinase n=1 Tax=Carex littledalei TaxID=544730 RepID=A0A833Q820_9POAL|nr:G-type lectin S-receptor-like serine/threonine-protein kinase [Carex littledalei]